MVVRKIHYTAFSLIFIKYEYKAHEIKNNTNY